MGYATQHTSICFGYQLPADAANVHTTFSLPAESLAESGSIGMNGFTHLNALSCCHPMHPPYGSLVMLHAASLVPPASSKHPQQLEHLCVHPHQSQHQALCAIPLHPLGQPLVAGLLDPVKVQLESGGSRHAQGTSLCSKSRLQPAACSYHRLSVCGRGKREGGGEGGFFISTDRPVQWELSGMDCSQETMAHGYFTSCSRQSTRA